MSEDSINTTEGLPGSVRYKEALLMDTREELQKVDSKSSILFATVGVILGALAAGVVSGSWSISRISKQGPRELVLSALVLGVIGLCLLGAAVKPRIHRPNQSHGDLYYFGHVEAYYPTWWERKRDNEKLGVGRLEFVAAMKKVDNSRYENRLDDQIWHLSHLVYWKYKFISIAMWTFALTVIIGAAALLWGLL